MNKLKLSKLQRAIVATEVRLDEGDGRVLEFPFSSEFPVDRWFGREILSHDAGAADLSRLNNAAPLLFNHDTDRLIGVCERAWIAEDKRAYVRVRFSSNECAQEMLTDVKDGILRNVSFGYRVEDMVLSRQGKDGEESEYTVTKWSPYEVSFVTIPADPTVGMGRSMDDSDTYEIEVKHAGEEPALNKPKGERMETTTQVPDVKVVQAEAVRAERERIAAITALGEKFKQGELARQMVEGGKSVDEFRAAVLEKMNVAQKPVKEGEAHLDLTDKEARKYSLVKAIRASMTGNWREAGFEKECSDQIAKRMGKETNGFFLPMNITLEERAAYAVGAPTTGGNIVATNLLASSFIDILRNKAIVAQMGAQMLSGLVGNVAIPRQTAAATAYWVAEATDVTESEMTFDQVTLSPKQIGARSQMSRLMLQQSTPDIEALVRNDLAQILALGIDLAAIRGLGTGGQPKGILNQSGIGSVAMGTNGGAVTLDSLVQLEGKVAVANADFGSLGYITNAKVINDMKLLKSTTGAYLWQGAEMGLTAGTPGMFNGYKVGRSNQVPFNLTKGTSSGVCSAAIFGNFADLIIGEWGVLEILANPYGAGFNSGGVDIRAMQTVDIAVRHPESFAAVSDFTTTL